MNVHNRNLGRVLVLAFASVASAAWADSLTVQNTGASAAMGGVYTSPYGIAVNGTPTLLICDDFETDISLGYTWSASPVTLTQIDSSTVAGLKFASSPYSSAILGGASNVVEDYATAAVLAAELLTLPNVGTGAENAETAGVLSYAIWSVFDSSLGTSLNSNGSTGYGSLNTTQVAAVNAAIANAENLASGATVGGTTTLSNISVNGQTLDGLTVYTPNPLAASQEFLQVQMPEPGYPMMLGLELLGAAGVILAFRRRRSQTKA